MSVGIYLGDSNIIAAWAFKEFNRVPCQVDLAVGIIEDNKLVGAAIFTGYNSIDACLSYYGKNTVTRGIIKCLARIALYQLRLTRCTVIVPKRPGFLLKKLPKFGFRFEGVQRRYYGPTDEAKYMGCRFVMFREDMERIAGISPKKAA